MSESALDTSILAWLEPTVGVRFLGYILSCDHQVIEALRSGAVNPTAPQSEVIQALTQFRQALPADLDEARQQDVVPAWLTQLADDGRLLAKIMHDATSEVVDSPPPPTTTDLEAALAELALASYPAYLLPVDRWRLPMMDPISTQVTSILFKHPAVATFAEAAIADSVFGAAFDQVSPHLGRYATIYRNTGGGGGQQLSMVPELLLRAAWRHLPEADFTPGAFAAQALEELRLVRDVLAGKAHTISAKRAFTGILMPPDSRLELSNGILRPVTEADRKLAPEDLKAQVSGADPGRDTTVINYDGDVVFDYNFPYKVRVLPPQEMDDPLAEWPQDLRVPEDLDRISVRLRFSLMLAVERYSRAQLVPTWRFYDDPLDHGRSVGWNDPRQGTGIMPTRLTEAEVLAWKEWYERLEAPSTKRVEVALTRTLRAIAERREPSDLLIDSVIAWENLFGTKEGEPTFRVTMCLAKLLETTPEARRALRTRLGKIYTLRSNIVHGNKGLQESEYPLCREALDIAIKAIRVLVSERTDILELPDGGTRSTALLLG